jgi:type IV secretory pathway TrbL component
MVGLSPIAGSVSIIVYLSLVIGVCVELFAPFFDRFHRKSPPLIKISQSFMENYQRDIALCMYVLCIILPIIFALLILGHGYFWIFEPTVLLVCAL